MILFVTKVFEKEMLKTKILFKKGWFSKWLNHNHSLIFEKKNSEMENYESLVL